MATVNLSGNFHPPSVDSGRTLPSSSNRVPSTSNETVLRKVKVEEVVSDKIEVKASDFQAKTTDLNEKIMKQEFNDQIKQIQQYNQSIDRTLQFQVDEELGVTIVRVVDTETDELIRQFPPEELINLSRRLKELNEEEPSSSNVFGTKGFLLKEKV
jgi:flagellar protein FlaG